MKALSIIWPIASLVFTSCFSRGESNDKIADKAQKAKPTVLSVYLKPGNGLSFNLPAKYHGKFHFKNNTKKDTVITQKLVINKPLLLAYNNIFALPDGALFRNYSLLLSPGDSVVLQRADDGALSMEYSSGFPNFIDSLIAPQQDQDLKKMGVHEVVQRIETSFKRNTETISKLNLLETQKDLLRKLNFKNRSRSIAPLLTDTTMMATDITDSLYNDLYQHADDIRSIDALDNQGIFGALIAYNAKKQNENISKHDVWACIAAADQQLKQTDFYKEYVTNCVAWNFINTPKEIGTIKLKLQAIHTREPHLDTLYRLADILSRTFTDFKQAKKELTTFDGGRYRYIIESDEVSANHEMKTINDLPAIVLYDFAGKQSDFKRMVTDKNKPLTVVDFWASWCVPCIAEIPHLKKIEHQFKDKPIQFVTISIDKEEDAAKWIAAAKQHGIYETPHQYRLAKFKESPLTKLLNIRNIPRYIVMNNKGNILNDDFLRPSNGNFELELLKYME